MQVCRQQGTVRMHGRLRAARCLLRVSACPSLEEISAGLHERVGLARGQEVTALLFRLFQQRHRYARMGEGRRHLTSAFNALTADARTVGP